MSRKSDRRLAEAASAPPNGAATVAAARARVGRLAGLISPEVKRAAKILGAGLVLAFVTTNLPPDHRGAAPLLCLAGSVLVAFVDYHRHDRRAFAPLVAVAAMATMVALAADDTPFAKDATAEATATGNQAAMVGPGKLLDGLKVAGNWSLHVALPWVLNVGIPGSIDTIKGLAS